MLSNDGYNKKVNKNLAWIEETISEIGEIKRLKHVNPNNIVEVPEYKRPSRELLNQFLDKETYGVSIDGVEVDNKILEDREPSDFSHFNMGRLSNTSIYNSPTVYYVNLLTNAEFERQKKMIPIWNKKYRTDSKLNSELSQSPAETFGVDVVDGKVEVFEIVDVQKLEEANK